MSAVAYDNSRHSANFEDISKDLLSAYESPKAQGLDPYLFFRRLNDTFGLCRNERVTGEFLKNLHSVLHLRVRSSIAASDNGRVSEGTDSENPFFDNFNSANISELILNIIQIERELRGRQINFDNAYSIDFDGKIRSNYGWIEKSYLHSTSNLSNTFFIPTLYDRVTSRADYFENRQRNSKFSAEILENIFLLLEEGPFSKDLGSKKKITRTLNRHSPDLFDNRQFDTLAAIHHEISENALSHAVNSKINHNSNSENRHSDFGAIAILKVQVFSYRKGADPAKAFHPDFLKYHSKVVGNRYGFRARNERSYLSISYCDTGLGIQDHLGQFSEDQKDDWINSQIDQIIDNRGTTRSFSGSGFGLRKSKSPFKKADIGPTCAS